MRHGISKLIEEIDERSHVSVNDSYICGFDDGLGVAVDILSEYTILDGELSVQHFQLNDDSNEGIFKSRQENAVDIAKLINSKFDDFIIINDMNEVVTNKFIITDNGDVQQIVDNDTDNDIKLVDIFTNDINVDNGMQTTISNYNELFNKWQFIPKCLVSTLEL